ncbi:DUF1206 domain-containing protein [Henriciella litoralis]|uniref:DUF1206 domain-containing protein n=1 Tax=Henriciella litoralis TaxID=568102 RepID=UPI000A01107D|nr:DUF1206 domain-containing protein [Henriciella litoralis]
MTDTPIPAPVAAIVARIGLGARALVYFAVSGLLIDAAISAKPDNGVSPGDAFRAVENEAGGRYLLIFLAIGLALYALWRYYQAILDPEDNGSDAKGIFSRLGMASSGTSYLLIGVAAVSVTFGSNSSGDGGKTEQTAKWLMEQPFGEWVVVLGGLALIGIGGAQVWRAKTGQWKNHIDLSGWAGKLTDVIAGGIAGRGVLFAIVGGFLVLGGWTADPDDIKGLAATLGWIRTQPYGLWLFIASALAIGVYGIYSAVQSVRYRFPNC